MSDIKFTPEYQVYSPKLLGIYPVSETDWNRIKRMVRAIVPAESWVQNGSFASFGVGVAAVFTLIGFSASKDVPEWAFRIAWAGFALGIVVAVLLFTIGASQKETVTQSSQNVIDEMESIETGFDKSPQVTIATPSTARPIGGASLGKGFRGVGRDS